MPRWLKRLLRPLIPDRVMARYRLRQHSLQVRTNVDVLLAGRRARRRWLAVTPDTYRVGPMPRVDADAVPDDAVVLGDERHSRVARAALAATGAEAAVVGPTAPLRLVGRRRTEPMVEPVTVAVRSTIFKEVSGVPGGDLVGLVGRIRDAGGRLALVPLGTVPTPRVRRTDPLPAPVLVVLAAVPMHDVGGGSRAAQLTLELLRNGVTVVYVAAFGSEEGNDLGLRFVHPRLEQYRLDEFDPESVASRVADAGWVLVEVPLPALGAPMQGLRRRGWRVCYDVIDRWSDPALGGRWYDARFERDLITESEVVVASAPDLAELVAAADREAPVVPNAVDAAAFSRPPGQVPDDFPAGGGPLVGYHGSLYGDWIDWHAIAEVAAAWPDARVVLIGDASKGHPLMPDNVHFLGLKPHHDLPDYVRRFDVGLIPFEVSPTTHAVSPLKVYEYLASGVPVAALPLRSLDGLDGVHTADRLVDAVSAALAAARPDPGPVFATHSWAHRVDTMLRALGVDPPPRTGAAPVRLTRPLVHHEAAARRVREWMSAPG